MCSLEIYSKEKALLWEHRQKYTIHHVHILWLSTTWANDAAIFAFLGFR